jgi:hypothetical protein
VRRLALFLVPVIALALAAGASARKTPRIALDEQAISAAQCTPAGSNPKLVVDVTFTLMNYADAGYADQWATDTVNRHLRIWRHSDGSYCAQIADANSKFVTNAGPSPTGVAFVPSGITGTFQGGYVTLDIVGKFHASYPTRGNLGSFDAKCDANFNCPGPHPGWTSYFSTSTADQFAHWGWLYDAGPNGVWLDQEDVVPPFGGDIRAS